MEGSGRAGEVGVRWLQGGATPKKEGSKLQSSQAYTITWLRHINPQSIIPTPNAQFSTLTEAPSYPNKNSVTTMHPAPGNLSSPGRADPVPMKHVTPCAGSAS